MKLLKFLLILVLVVSLETSKVYHTAYSTNAKNNKLGRKSKSKTKGDCVKATCKGFINFVFGVFHGFAGFEEKHNLKKQCRTFKGDIADLAFKLGITDEKDSEESKEAVKEFNFEPDAVDGSFLKLYFKTDRTSEEQAKLNKEITAVEKNYKNYTCYKKDLKDTFIGSRVLAFGNRVINGISSLIPAKIKSAANRTSSSAARIAKSVAGVAGRLSKPLYEEVCSLRKIVFLLVSMILSPGKITIENISDLIDEIMKQLKLLGKFLSAGKKAAKFLKKSWDWFVDKMADSDDFLISIAGEMAQEIREDLERNVEKLKEKSLELIKKASTKITTLKDKVKNKVKEFLTRVQTEVKNFISSISKKLWNNINELEIFKSISDSISNLGLVEATTKTLSTIKKNLQATAKAIGEIFKVFIKIFKCAFSAASALIAIAKNVLSIVLNIFVIISAFSLAGGSYGVVIPVVVAMFVDMAMAIICNSEAFEMMFQALKYSYTTKTAYAAGAALGLAINTIGNSDFIVIPLVDAYAGIVKDGIPDIGEHILESIMKSGDKTEDQISKASDSLDIFNRILPVKRRRNRLS